MACKNCNCLDLGCFYHNLPKVLTGLVCEITGIHDFVFKSGKGQFVKQIYFEYGDQFYIPDDVVLNENLSYTLVIFDPANEPVKSGDLECFKFTVEINYTDICTDELIYPN